MVVLKARQQLARDNLVRSTVCAGTLTGGRWAILSGLWRIQETPRDLGDRRTHDSHDGASNDPAPLKSVEQSDWKIEFERQARVLT